MYVNEFVPETDRRYSEYRKVKILYGVEDQVRQWTIDRESGSYLIRMRRGHGEDLGLDDFHFVWRDQNFLVCLRSDTTKLTSSTYLVKRKLLALVHINPFVDGYKKTFRPFPPSILTPDIQIPSDLRDEIPLVLADIRAALFEFGSSGVYDQNGSVVVELEF